MNESITIVFLISIVWIIGIVSITIDFFVRLKEPEQKIFNYKEKIEYISTEEIEKEIESPYVIIEEETETEENSTIIGGSNIFENMEIIKNPLE